MELLITSEGTIRTLYGELIPLEQLGALQVARASHVEPDAQGRWWADLGPSEGPVLGPFPQRSAALQAERHWLTEHVLFPDSPPLRESPSSNVVLPPSENVTSAASSAGTTFQTPARGSDLPPQPVRSPLHQYAHRSVRETRSER